MNSPQSVWESHKPEDLKKRFSNTDKTQIFAVSPPAFAQAQHTNLDVRAGVNLVNSIPWRSPRFSVQVVTLNEDRVVAEASNPHVAFAFALQLHPFPYVQPSKEKQFQLFLNTL